MSDNFSKNKISFEGERKTAAIIDLNAIRKNITGIKNKVGENVLICPAVKANAYGHGAVEISKMFEKEKLANYLGVATVEEGVELRNAGIKLPILLFGVTFKDQLNLSIKNDLTLAVVNMQTLMETVEIAKKMNKRATIHLKVDTGMGRIGCKPSEALNIVKNAYNYKDFVYLEGLFTHFPKSDEKDKTFSYKQIEIFKSLKQQIEKENIHIPIYHMANSGAILDLKESYFDMVRPGVMAYGYYPSDETTESIKLYPSMQVRTEIAFIKKVESGTSISYGGIYVAQTDRYIASLPIGYADGINRLLSNKHNVLINGKQYKIAGRICMDQIMVDLCDDFYDVGTQVIIFGYDTITASDVAREVETIPYEVTCWISKRVKRYYINN
ncbi:MAG TPA: alanine racemase [Exilispira sp.]|nr:alanine racemase [Exilispira sp.]